MEEQDDLLGTSDGAENRGHIAAHEEAALEDEEEEEECRVCRGPAEEGRPLFSPCKCSGSIGLTHQDCLTSWLEVTRGGGRCELCSHKFKFAPKYADGAPDHLPPIEVLAGLTRRAAVRWLPYALRALLAASLWLCILPLATAYLYQGWIHRPSSITTRWKWELLAGDAVSGAVVTAVIIVSFLSLMSFADFLRFQWQQDQQEGGEEREEGEEEAEQDRDDLPGQFEVGDEALPAPVEGGIDNGFLENDDEHIERIRDRIERRRHRRVVRVEEEEEEPPQLDEAEPDAQPERMPQIPLPLDRNAVGVMDQRELFFPQHMEHAERHDQGYNRMEQDELHNAMEDLLEDPMRADHENVRRETLAAAALRRQIGDDHDRRAGFDGEELDRGDDRVRYRPPQPLDAEFQQDIPQFHDDGQLNQRFHRGDDIPPIGDPDEELENMMRAQEEEMEDADQERIPQEQQDNAPDRGANAPQNGQDENNDRFEPQFEPLDPVFDQDEAMDVEFQIALDELLGFRGPFGALIRNLFWLLAFNTTYLGLFAFIPHRIGSMASKSTKLTFLAESLSRLLQYFPLEELIGVNTTKLTNVTYATSAINATSANGTEFFMGRIINELNAESRRLQTMLQLSDVATVVLGYLSMATFVFLWHLVLSLYRKFHKSNGRHVPAEDTDPINDGLDIPEELDGRNHQPARHRVILGDHDEIQMPGNEWDGGEPDPAIPPQPEARDAIGEKLALGVDCAVAIVKVGILLFLKMLLLPLLLGFWLDIATLPLFDSTIHDRAQQAGADLFGSILLHWVAGITFMLLVTVSVLQLREVAHPDLLARVIRPQEPQPDLLGNLLQESGATHAKRMLLSLAIYAALLSIHVWLPTKLLVSWGMSQLFPIFRPKFWHIFLPQLQVPVELLIFHLTMLAFLEKYKNHIGQMQHKWLVCMCRFMGLTDYILPRDVDKFVLVGSKQLLLQKDGVSNKENGGYSAVTVQDEDAVTDATSASSTEEDAGKTSSAEESLIKNRSRHEIGFSEQPDLELDPFWAELISMHENGGPTDDFIDANLNKVTSLQSSPLHQNGTVTREGKRVLDASQSHLRLTLSSATNVSGKTDSVSRTSGRSSASRAEGAIMLPTSIGAYRICRRVRDGSRDDTENSAVLDFWKEVPGNPIPRPPEGWDDLGVGGAEVQGRWAWGKERKADVEEGVAQRLNFFPCSIRNSTDGVILSTMKRCLKAALLILKLAVLLGLSWLAILVTVLLPLLSAPLIAGRFIFFLLQIPDGCFHDPIAYCIGGVIIFPAVYKISEYADDKGDGRPWRWMWDWASSFRRPSLIKFRIVFQAAFLWLGLTPLLIGMTYHLCLVKSPSFWTGEEPLMDARTFLLAWGVGGVFLNAWAALCYLGAFGREFWMHIAFGGAEADVAAAANPLGDGGGNDGIVEDAAIREGNSQTDLSSRPERRVSWQDSDGRIAHYFSTISSVLLKWEWDKVDRSILLDECAIPIARQLMISFLVPVLTFLVWLAITYVLTGGGGGAGVMLPFIGLIEKGLYRRFLFRCLVSTTISIQLGLAFQSPLQHWFHAAHKAARDDRYLIGEILLDYVRPTAKKKDTDNNALPEL